MIGRSFLITAVLGAVVMLTNSGDGGGRVCGLSLYNKNKNQSKPTTKKYYSYKTFKRLGVPAIFYSAAAKVATKVLRVKPRSIVTAPSASVDKNNSTVLLPKVAIVTGSNTGVGFQTAKTLAVDHGYQVVIACRSAEKAETACAAINAAVNAAAVAASKYPKGSALFVKPLDLSNLDSVRDFGKAINDKYPNRIDVLINNAGKNSAGNPTQQSTTGPTNSSSDNSVFLDDLFTTNFLGHFLLTRLLLETCSRVVNLSSVMHHFPVYSKRDGGSDAATNDVESVEFWRQAAIIPPVNNSSDDGLMVRKPYAPSKLAALLFSMELNRRYGGNNDADDGAFRSIAVNPGSV